LKALACSGDANAVYVVRGLLKTHLTAFGLLKNLLAQRPPLVENLSAQPPGLVENLGAQAPGLVDAILKPDCPVSADLTDADKAALKRLAKEAQPGESTQ
jgi:hypothetical protein